MLTTCQKSVIVQYLFTEHSLNLTQWHKDRDLSEYQIHFTVIIDPNNKLDSHYIKMKCSKWT